MFTLAGVAEHLGMTWEVARRALKNGQLAQSHVLVGENGSRRPGFNLPAVKACAGKLLDRYSALAETAGRERYEGLKDRLTAAIAGKRGSAKARAAGA